MTNQEAIDIIKTAIAQMEWCYPMDYVAAFDKAIEALAKDNNVTDKSGWISVKDRLPELDQEVFVFTNGLIRVYSILQVDTETADVCWEDDYGYFHEVDEVTHWMPLPEPPKEETQE